MYIQQIKVKGHFDELGHKHFGAHLSEKQRNKKKLILCTFYQGKVMMHQYYFSFS